MKTKYLLILIGFLCLIGLFVFDKFNLDCFKDGIIRYLILYGTTYVISSIYIAHFKIIKNYIENLDHESSRAQLMIKQVMEIILTETNRLSKSEILTKTIVCAIAIGIASHVFRFLFPNFEFTKNKYYEIIPLIVIIGGFVIWILTYILTVSTKIVSAIVDKRNIVIINKDCNDLDKKSEIASTLNEITIVLINTISAILNLTITECLHVLMLLIILNNYISNLFNFDEMIFLCILSFLFYFVSIVFPEFVISLLNRSDFLVNLYLKRIAPLYLKRYKKLYIIGNGFDIFHGISSRYADFREFVRLKSPELFQAIELSFPKLDNLNWSNIESVICEYENPIIFFNLTNDDFERILVGTEYVDTVNMKGVNKINKNAVVYANHLRVLSKLKIELDNWIDQLFLNKSPKIRFGGGHFLNFNYTKTMEIIYRIRKIDITYVHLSGFEKLKIFGKEFELEKYTYYDCLDKSEIPRFAPAFMGGRSAIEAKDWLFKNRAFEEYRNYLNVYQKKPQYIFSSKFVFSCSLERVSTIIVFGFSFGLSDEPYIKKLLQVAPNALWKIYYYSDCDRNRIILLVEKIGLSKYLLLDSKEIIYSLDKGLVEL